jgi:hypothetical protein
MVNMYIDEDKFENLDCRACNTIPFIIGATAVFCP